MNLLGYMGAPIIYSDLPAGMPLGVMFTASNVVISKTIYSARKLCLHTLSFSSRKSKRFLSSPKATNDADLEIFILYQLPIRCEFAKKINTNHFLSTLTGLDSEQQS